MEHEMISVKNEELICGIDEGSDEGEPKLEIAENLTTSSSSPVASNTNQEAVESLLMLGRQAVVGPEALQRQRAASMSSVAELQSDIPIRRHSSSSESRVPPQDKGAVVSYYQRMRERNNEASKRCRLKRRMKAVSMENQASMLQVANKQLRARIQRLENVGAALKEGVKKIQAGQCACDLTVGTVRQTSRDFFDPEPGTGRDLPNYEMISRSRLVREQEMQSQSGNGSNGHVGGSVGYTATATSCSSEEEIVTTNPTSPVTLQPQVIVPQATVSQQQQQQVHHQPMIPRPTRTALDVINETIVKTLDSPLNLVKSQPQSQQVILISQSPRPSVDSIASTDSSIKIEPVEATKADSTVVSCIANANGASICRGEMLNLSKLACYLDLITRKVVRDDGSSAMERAIIKSRLKIPFWSADDSALFICGSHRTSIVQAMDLKCCALCNRRRTPKKARQMAMYTITYSMSLEYYTRNGHILPIGLAVCGICKDKHLKSVDFSNSRTIPAPDPEPIILPDSSYKRESNVLKPIKTEVSIYPPPLNCSPPKKVRQMSQSGVSSTNGEVIVTPISTGYNSTDSLPITSHKTTLVPVSNNGGNNSNIFAKIGRLNEALQAINPRYQPIGFSITSMDSCSPGVLQDALVAAETGVFTLLSVIAPGQETQLWEAIRPTLDKKLKK